MSEEATQIAEERAKGKGERERYTQLNAEFQRIARRDKKASINENCKEIEGKTRNLFKKIGDISCKACKGIFHARAGTVKARK